MNKLLTATNSHRTSLSQQAYELIRHKIVSLELPPGSVIDEAALQAELRLGRTPIREALKRLEIEQLVLILPRRGMFVTEIGIRDLQHLFEVRLNLESLAARLAAKRGTDKHWQQMEEVLNQLPEGLTSANNENLIAIDETCHRIMYDATGNEFLQNTLSTLYALSLRLWYFSLNAIGDMHEAIIEHKQILAALKNKDGRLAAQLLEQHIQVFQEEIQSVMIEQ